MNTEDIVDDFCVIEDDNRCPYCGEEISLFPYEADGDSYPRYFPPPSSHIYKDSDGKKSWIELHYCSKCESYSYLIMTS
jgi:hypothetical protein